MEQIVTFNKNFSDRLEEYITVFGGVKLLPISQIKQQWSDYLKLQLADNGWQAFWKISRFICSKLDIPYPTVVLVHVCNINYKELDAQVEIIAIQGDLTFPTYKHTASLIKLWPTRQQPATIDAEAIADELDKLRFFYINVVMPWDFLEDANRITDSDSNLEERLRFYFNMKHGIIPKNKTIKARSLLADIQHVLEHFETEFEFSTALNSLPAYVEYQTKKFGNEFEFSNVLNTECYSSVNGLIAVYYEIHAFKTEVELLQIKFQRTVDAKENKNKTEENYCLIFNNKCSSNDNTEYLKSVEYITKTKYKSSICLKNALENASSGDCLILCPGKHLIHYPEILEDGGVLKSALKDCSKTILDTKNKNSFLEFSGKDLLIENLTIDLSVARCGIIVHSGEITFKNCQITGNSASEHGIIAMPESQVILEHCSISGFNTGVYTSSHSKVRMLHCNISNVSSAIKIFDYSRLLLLGCKFFNYSKNCIYFETEIDIGVKEQIADDSLIKSNININISDCTFDTEKNNGSIIVIANKSEDVFAVNT